MSGGDFPLQRPNGVIDFDARYLLEADDGAVIYMQNRGYRWARSPEIAARMARNEDVGTDDYYMRVAPRFEAPEGPHAWMSQHVFIGVAEKIQRQPHSLLRGAVMVAPAFAPLMRPGKDPYRAGQAAPAAARSCDRA
jgi:hypothetical protein